MTELRWRGHTHKELYLLIHDGPGPAASAEPARRWGAVSAALTEVGEDLHAALSKAGAAWAGHAADNAYDRLSTTADWAAHTATSAAEMQTAVENQAGHIATARAEMPKPEDVPAVQPDPTVGPVVQVIAVQADLEPLEATAASGEERAFEVMAAYELNSNTTTAALASFDTPAGLTEVTTVHDPGGATQNPATAGTASAGLASTGGHPADGHRPDPGRPLPATSGAAATAGAAAPVHTELPHRSLPPQPAPAPAPGNLSGAAPGPFFAPNTGRAGRQPRSADRAAAGSPRPGATSLGAQVNDLQAAAAGQAAANNAAHPAAAPLAASPAQGQDKLAMRRFGLDAIGSSQWFGDEPSVGQTTRRRRDFREQQQEEVTESVDILGEQHKLQPTVIGDGPR